MHSYPFHVEVTAPDRAAARYALLAIVPRGADRIEVSEHTAALVAAIEERGELHALHALSQLADDAISDRDGGDLVDVLGKVLAHVRDRIAELTDQ